MDNPFQSPAIISFCPGILGLERGLERAIGKLNVLAYCEIEAFICENLVAGMESGVLAPALIWTDAKTFPAQFFRDCVDWIIGGYPCPPFSYAGNRKGEEDPRHLWPYLRNHGETIKPRCGFFFENVAGHLSLGFDQVYKDLADMGYSVEAGIFTAEEVGAPHQRERLFILALANSYLNGFGTGTRRTTEESGQAESEAQRQEWHQLLRKWMRDVIGNSSSELANTQRTKWWQNYTGKRGSEANNVHCQGEKNTAGFEQCCEELVNPSIFPQRKQTNETISQPDAGEARAKLSIRCFEMVHTGVHHLERFLPQKFDEERWQGQDEGQARSSDMWPARPGEQQYDWEEPRTIERGLGRTVDGYSFREDLLRALGNSVVEQTAELAFITLLLKHLKNLS